MKVKILAKRQVADDVCRFELEREDGAWLPPFTAGAHIDVATGSGIVRQYSLCNDPGERRRYVIAVLRDPVSRGGSIAMHGLCEGDTLDISEPRNHFQLDDRAKHSVLVAGGIGITPILSMARQLHARGASFELHYCARDAARMALRDEIEASGFAGRARFYLDAENSRLDPGELLKNPAGDTHLYVCGPSGLIDATIEAAGKAGWAPANVHREHFAAAFSNHGAGTPFTVKLARSGKSTTVGADETLVRALARIGVEVPVSCEQGVCGTCLTRVLGGVPDHRDAYLMDDERAANNQLLPCCSRALTPELVLDL